MVTGMRLLASVRATESKARRSLLSRHGSGRDNRRSIEARSSVPGPGRDCAGVIHDERPKARTDDDPRLIPLQTSSRQSALGVGRVVGPEDGAALP